MVKLLIFWLYNENIIFLQMKSLRTIILFKFMIMLVFSKLEVYFQTTKCINIKPQRSLSEKNLKEKTTFLPILEQILKETKTKLVLKSIKKTFHFLVVKSFRTLSLMKFYINKFKYKLNVVVRFCFKILFFICPCHPYC